MGGADQGPLRAPADGDFFLTHGRLAPDLLAHGLTLAAGLLVLAMALCAWRMLRGPRAQDRVLGLDTLYLNGMLLIVVLGIRDGTGLALEAALIIGLLGFTATAALAKFLMRGEVIR